MMHRNLDRRVEALVEIRDPDVRTELQRAARPCHRPGDFGLAAAAGRQLAPRATDEPGGEPLRDYQLTLLRTTAAPRRRSSAPSHTVSGRPRLVTVEDRGEVPRPPAVRASRAGRRAHRRGSTIDPRQQQLRAVYWDTSDLRLAREGVTLRHRSGEGPGKDGWHLKLPIREGRVPDASIGAAATSCTRRVTRAIPDELRDLVTPWVRTAVLGRSPPWSPSARPRAARRPGRRRSSS